MKVIVSGMVWLPMDELEEYQLDNIRRELTILPRKTTDIQSKKDPEPIFLFQEDEGRRLFGVPRQYYLDRKSAHHEETLDISYGRPMRKLETKFEATGPYSEQDDALDALFNALDEKEWGGVLLRAAPGFGKTICSLEFARRIGRKTLILVHKEFLVRQWKKRIQWLMPNARVGIIRQSSCEFDVVRSSGEEPDFVIALLQSLAKDSGGKYPSDLYSAFGTIISDECHRVSAGSWSGVIPRFNAAWRIGVSATPRRKDGAQDVFLKHISQITYSADAKMMCPRIRFLYTESTLRPISRGEYFVSISDLNSAQVINQLAGDMFRTRHIVDDIVEAVLNKRKVLVISERLEHLKEMAGQLNSLLFNKDLSFIPKIDFYTGQWFSGEEWEKTVRGKKGNILHRRGDPKFKTRTSEELDVAEGANVIFATKQMCVDGDSVVVDVDSGVPYRVKDLEPGVRLMSYDEDSGHFHANSVCHVWKTGEKDILRIACGRGGSRSVKSISVTGDHRVFTQRGWLRADDIVVGDWLAAPGFFGSDNEYCGCVSAEDALLLGYFIGDGNTSHIDQGVCGFYNTDNEIVGVVDRLLSRHGASLKEKEDGKYSVSLGGKCGAGCKSSFRLLVENHGLDGKRAWEKSLSKELLFCDRESAGSLIAGLIDSDGHVGRKKVDVSHSSSSRVLAYQIQYLLLRNGIVSFVRESKSNNSKRNRSYWSVHVSGIYWVRKLFDLIGDYLTSRKRDNFLEMVKLNRSEDGVFLRVPEEFWVHAVRVMRSVGLNKKDVFGDVPFPVGASVHRNGVHRSALEKMAEVTKNELLSRWVGSECLWERVSSIENIGNREVYDLTMNTSSNFVCDGFVVHNCEEGLDIPPMDVLVMATPMSDIEQVVGRVQRWCFPEKSKCERLCFWRAGECKGKPSPIVVDVVDERVDQLDSKNRRRIGFYKGVGAM